MYTLLNMKEENKAYDNRQQPLLYTPFPHFCFQGWRIISY